MFYRTKLCRFNQKGRCTKGEACAYAHSDTQVQPLPNFYKTRFCFQFRNSGYCEQGELCSYAHQGAELRPKQGSTLVPKFANHATGSTATASQSVVQQIRVADGPCTAAPIQVQCAVRRKAGSHPGQNCQDTEVSLQTQFKAKANDLLVERSLTTNHPAASTSMSHPTTTSTSYAGFCPESDNQQEDEADHEWKALGFAIVRNTFLEWKPMNWVESCGAAQRSQSAGGRLGMQDSMPLSV